MSSSCRQTPIRSRPRRAAMVFALLVLAFVSTARAQLWRGPAALEVRAEGQGRDAGGGAVELVYLDLDPPAGPPPVPLDNRGRAVVGGLAEGMWRVSVSREGYMTYQAEVQVRRDDKPELVATFQQNVPGAERMMKVRINRARPTGDPVPPPPQIAQRPAPAPTPREPPREPAPLPRDTPLPPVFAPAPQPEPEELPAAPAPAPTQTPAQAPAPSTPPPSSPEPQPAPPTPPRTEPITPPAPMPSTPPPAPVPSIEPAPAPAPATPMAPTAPTVRRRSYADRTCYECKPGESSLSVERVVAAGAGCGTGVRDILAGNWQPATGLPAGCGVLQVTLPPGARYTGYRYETQGQSEPTDCMAGQECPGGGRWPVNPMVQRGEAATTVSAAFENPGNGEERRAVLTVYYTTGERSGTRPRP